MSHNDSFKSTIFYPIPVNDDRTDVKPMKQCIDTGLPVFARDVDSTAKKAFMACGYEHFCFKYYAKDNDRTRHTYELLQGDKPTKIFCDFDHSEMQDRDDFFNSTNEFIKAIIIQLPNICKLLEGVDIPFYVLEASTDVKLSRHVIFECFLENMIEVEMFMKHMLTICPCKYLDMKNYTRIRSFRILYSYKYGKTKQSALKIPGVDDNKYNPFHVFKTLIQAKIPPHYDGPFKEIEHELCKNVFKLNLKQSQQSEDGYACSYILENVPPGLDHFIDDYGSGATILSCKENETFITCIIGGLKCPWIGQMHKNNNQYFTICKHTLRGFFQCADKDCESNCDGPITYNHIDVSHIWRESLL